MSTDDTVSVRYMVDDVEEAIAFYTHLLGFEVLTSFPPAFADVQRDRLRLLLSGPKSSAGRPMPDGVTPGPGGWNRIHLIVDDIEQRSRAFARPAHHFATNVGGPRREADPSSRPLRQCGRALSTGH